MKHLFMIGILVGATAIAVGCSKDDQAAPPANLSPSDPPEVATAPAEVADPTTVVAAAEQKIAELSIENVESLLANDGCTPIDANSIVTRKKHGSIPGSTLLSHYTKYELSELPADKARKLVFYCSNESCGASHAAAERALLAGYSDVAILPAGIAGWQAAGKSVTTM